MVSDDPGELYELTTTERPDPDSANATTIDEGGSVSFSVTRTGSATQDLTVGIEVDDPKEVMRGNHWDPAPDIPSEIIIAAGGHQRNLHPERAG